MTSALPLGMATRARSEAARAARAGRSGAFVRLLRRPSAREIGLLVPPEFRRRFRGQVIVHDVEADDLVEVGAAANVPLRVNPALVETDLVVCVTAAETVLQDRKSVV